MVDGSNAIASVRLGLRMFSFMLCGHSVFLATYSIGPQPLIPIRPRMSSCYAAAGSPFFRPTHLRAVILKAGKRLPLQGKRRPEGSVLRLWGTAGVPVSLVT